MARTKLELNKAEFQKIVTDLELQQVFPNPSHLWKAVEATDWAKGQKPRPLTAAVCYQRAKELGIVVSTVSGKRVGGVMSPEQKEAMAAGRKGRRPRAEKMKLFSESFAEMRKGTPSRFLPLVDQAEKGSLRAAIKLQCLGCTCFTPSEIKNCGITGCPLFPHRPYQASLEEVVTVEEEVTSAPEEAA